MKQLSGRFARRTAGPAAAAFFVVAFCLLLLWRDPRFFWVDDFQLFYGPLFEDLKRATLSGERQILCPYSWAMNNVAGEYQFGTFSIFITPVVLAIWSLPIALPVKAALLSLVHMGVLASGIFALSRQRGLPAPLAMMAALAASLSGWIICWAATDWVTALMAFAWLPWAWWSFEWASRSTRSRWRWITPGVFVYLLLTAGWPFTVLMLALLTVWLACRYLSEMRRLSALKPLVVGWLFGIGLSSPALIELSVELRKSARGKWPDFFLNGWTVPWQALPGFVIPSWPAQWPDFAGSPRPHLSIELACGLTPVAGALAAMLLCRREWWRAVRWEVALFAVVLVLSMLPSISPFRWSFRYLPLVHLLLALIGAESFRILWSRRLLIAAPLTGLALLMAAGIAAFALGHPWSVAARYFNFAVASLTLVWVGLSRVSSERIRLWLPAGATFLILLATYWWIPAHQSVGALNLTDQILEPGPLSRDRLYLSLFEWPGILAEARAHPEPNYGALVRPGNTFAFAGLHFVNGYGGFGPPGVSQVFDMALHGSPNPAAASFILTRYTGPRALLAFIGIDGLIVGNGYKREAQELSSEWQLAFSSGEADVYHRIGPPLAHVRSPELLPTRPDEIFAPLWIDPITETRMRVQVKVTPLTEHPGALEEDIGMKLETAFPPRTSIVTFSRPWLPGYRASLNGQAVKVQSFYDLVPFVELPPDSHGQLDLEYRPRSLAVGYAIAAASLFAMALTLDSASLRSG